MKIFQTSLDCTTTDTGLIIPLDKKQWPEQVRQGFILGVYAHDSRDNQMRLVAVGTTRDELSSIADNLEKYRTKHEH